MALEGYVRREAVNAASKSARVAVVLVVDAQVYVLRRRGAPAMGDSALEAFIGHRVRAVGVRSANQFICSVIDIID
jgi:hypothetical protein